VSGEYYVWNMEIKDTHIDEIYFLDRVLEWFSMYPEEFKGGEIIARVGVTPTMCLSNIVEHYWPEFNNTHASHDIQLIFDKLHKDGYLDKYSHFVTGDPIYSINFNGKFFSRKEGGYAAKAKTEKRRKRIQNLKDWLLIAGSYLAGIGTVLLFAVELLKHFVWERH